ncbi:MAG: type II toxin-antitoxin system RelE/ParE family toxin [Planctomycetota bacterium]
MSPPVVFRPQAERELLDAEQWYEERGPGLGRRFRAAVDQTVSSVSTRPLSFATVDATKRRALVSGFPYCLYFAVIEDRIVVVGVLHARRDPTVWRSRR